MLLCNYIRLVLVSIGVWSSLKKTSSPSLILFSILSNIKFALSLAFHHQHGIKAPVSLPWRFHLPIVIPSTMVPLSIRLDKLNYAFWQSQTLPVVKAHDLEDFLLGTLLKPTSILSNSTNSHDPIRNPNYLSWM